MPISIQIHQSTRFHYLTYFWTMNKIWMHISICLCLLMTFTVTQGQNRCGSEYVEHLSALHNPNFIQQKEATERAIADAIRNPSLFFFWFLFRFSLYIFFNYFFWLCIYILFTFSIYIFLINIIFFIYSRIYIYIIICCNWFF